jgi:hypothetical protein
MASYDSIIQKASSTYGIDDDLIRAVIQQESGGRNGLTSSAGAQGLMQLMPATARSLGVTDPNDPVQNIMAGSKYLAQQIKAFGGDVRLGLAAYNAGAGNVKKYGGIPPFKETRNYVNKIMSNYTGAGITGEGTGETSTETDITGTVFNTGVRVVLILLVMIVGFLFFVKAFPVTNQVLDLANPVKKVKAVKKLVK